jgi:hypothetical protein
MHAQSIYIYSIDFKSGQFDQIWGEAKKNPNLLKFLVNFT